MRRLVFVVFAVVVAACSSGGPSGRPGQGTGSPNLMGASFAAPSVDVTPETTIVPADISSWVVIAPEGQHFGVAIPGKPAIRSTTLSSLRAPTTEWTYTDQVGRAYQVARSRLPQGAISGDSKADLDRLAGTLSTTLAGSSMAAQSVITVDGRPGIRYVLTSSDQRAQGLLVLDASILYRVSVAYPSGQLDSAYVEAFLGSFALST